MSRILVFAVTAIAALMAGCASLPPPEGRTATTALTDTAATRLGRAVAADVAANPGKTGIHALPEPHDAFAARVLLAAAAEKSLDAQYYIWHGDQVGYLLFEALWQAAERGVRVRLLLDDLNTGGLDPTIAALDAHPNIEVRLYNPLVQRGARVLNFVTDFTRVNRRMHNKSFTVDNQVSVVGGRNIGNEYFGAGSGIVFADLDVIAVGAAVPEVSKEFDLYWNSASAYPAASFVGAPGPDGAADLEARFAATRADPESVAYLEAVRATPLVRDLLDRQLALEWTHARARVRRPGQDARHDRPDRRAALPGARAHDGSAGEDARPRLAVLRARRRGHRRAGGAGRHGREGAHPHQLAGVVRGECRARGLREAPRTTCSGPVSGSTRSSRPRREKRARRRSSSARARPRACTRRRSPWTAAASSSARSTSTSARRG